VAKHGSSCARTVPIVKSARSWLFARGIHYCDPNQCRYPIPRWNHGDDGTSRSGDGTNRSSSSGRKRNARDSRSRWISRGEKLTRRTPRAHTRQTPTDTRNASSHSGGSACGGVRRRLRWGPCDNTVAIDTINACRQDSLLISSRAWQLASPLVVTAPGIQAGPAPLAPRPRWAQLLTRVAREPQATRTRSVPQTNS
jgi:hypothetical protein